MGHDPILNSVAHRPYPLPLGRFLMTQRWNDLLFAHWPVPVEMIARLLPAGLEVDAFDGWAWVGVVPFWMDRVQALGVGVPGAKTFPELNVRTYVRSKATRLAGVFFFSLDAASPLAVIGARMFFHLPYFLARMSRVTTADVVEYKSERLLTRRPARFEATYRALETLERGGLGSIEHFLTERYALFTAFGGRLLVGHIHHLPWPLRAAEAEIRVNEMPAAHGITLPNQAPILHFARELEVYLWTLSADRL